MKLVVLRGESQGLSGQILGFYENQIIFAPDMESINILAKRFIFNPPPEIMVSPEQIICVVDKETKTGNIKDIKIPTIYELLADKIQNAKMYVRKNEQLHSDSQ